MRKWTLLLLCALVSAPASAKDPPPGSYRQTCSGISVSGDVLSAVCQDRDGNGIATSLHFTDCNSEVWNAGGHLICNKGRETPGGSYQQSCRDWHTDFKNLQAVCKDRDGNWHVTTLPGFPGCKGDISNDGGRLRCSTAGAAPGGTYTQTCRDVWTSPHELHATCQTRSGDWIISTLDLRGCKDGPSNGGGELLCNKGVAPPPGTYVKSCRDVWMDGKTLKATCKGAGSHDDTWFHTQIADEPSCKSPVSNVYGCLACDKGDKVPAGLYHTTCCGITRRGELLSASCQTMENSWNRSSFDLTAKCRSDVYNLDGFLTCMRGDFDPPEGSYVRTCRDIVTKNGGTLTATCRTEDGGWRHASLNTSICDPHFEIWNKDGTILCTTFASEKSAPSGPKNPPPPPPVCNVFVIAHTSDCTNVDGSSSSIDGPCATECGSNADEAKARAEAALAQQRCLGEANGCCSVIVDQNFGVCGE